MPKLFADRAAAINPGDITLLAAYQSAGVPMNHRNMKTVSRGSQNNTFTFRTDGYNGYCGIRLRLPQSRQPHDYHLLFHQSPFRREALGLRDQWPEGCHAGQRPHEHGQASVTFDGSRLASGVYFYQFESAGLNKTGKMLLLK